MASLKEELEAHEGDVVYLGTRSSFFYVGPAREALDDMVLIDRMERAYAALIGSRIGFAKIHASKMPKCCIGDRSVVEAYERDSGVEHERVIIVEGREFGAFWTREEYLRGRRAFRAALNRATGVAT